MYDVTQRIWLVEISQDVTHIFQQRKSVIELSYFNEKM